MSYIHADIWPNIVLFLPDLTSYHHIAQTCRLLYEICRLNRENITQKFLIHINNIAMINGLYHFDTVHADNKTGEIVRIHYRYGVGVRYTICTFTGSIYIANYYNDLKHGKQEIRINGKLVVEDRYNMGALTEFICHRYTGRVFLKSTNADDKRQFLYNIFVIKTVLFITKMQDKIEKLINSMNYLLRIIWTRLSGVIFG